MADLDAASSLTRHRSFVRFWCARTFTNGAFMMQGVAVGWQIYALTNDPLDLGLVGLVQFFPLLATSIVAGQVLALFDRRVVASVCQVGKALAALALAVGTAQGWLDRESMFAILFLSGTARAFEIPTMHALLPGVVPMALLPRAIAASASAQQTAVICGPSLGGLLYGLGPATVYATCTAIFIAASVLISGVEIIPRSEPRRPVTLETVFAGFAYIRSHPILLGAISLDLFAVLLGGVTALLPIYARDILHTGPWGLGLLRAAPAAGALLMSLWLTRHALERRVGPVMFASVAGFGVATLVFALSTSFALSLASLLALGALDMISMVIRGALVQLETPDAMRGRVSAINAIFINTSNQLGEFESGITAAWFGTVPSVLIGGVGTLLVVGLWMWWFPALRRRDLLHSRSPQSPV